MQRLNITGKWPIGGFMFTFLLICIRLRVRKETCYIQLFRERLSYKRGKTAATMSKVITGNGDFTGNGDVRE